MNKTILFSVLGITVLGAAIFLTLGGKTVPLVSVNDQPIRDGQIVVSEATAPAASWLVIQTETNGAPGPVIGYTKLRKGENKNVSVKVDAQKTTPKLFAMIHEDNGKKDEFDFPGNDMPLVYNDDMVSKIFSIQ